MRILRQRDIERIIPAAPLRQDTLLPLDRVDAGGQWDAERFPGGVDGLVRLLPQGTVRVVGEVAGLAERQLLGLAIDVDGDRGAPSEVVAQR